MVAVVVVITLFLKSVCGVSVALLPSASTHGDKSLSLLFQE